MNRFGKHKAAIFAQALARYRGKKKLAPIAGGDLAWLDDEFRTFNAANDYPLHVAAPAGGDDRDTLPLCSFHDLRRYGWEIQRKPIRWLLNRMGAAENTPDDQFLKKAG